MTEKDIKTLLAILEKESYYEQSNTDDYDVGYTDGYSDGVIEASKIVKDFFEKLPLIKSVSND